MTLYTFLGLHPDGRRDEHEDRIEIEETEDILSHPLLAHIPTDLRWKVVEIYTWQKRVCYPLTLPALGPRPMLAVPDPALLLLDVDGVVNMTPLHREDQVALYPDVVEVPFYSSAHNQSFAFRYSPSVVQSINRWATRAEIRWATSWVHLARYILAPLIGLHDFEPMCERSKRWYQGSDVPADVLARDVIWIDDEIEPWWSDAEHLKANAKSFRPLNTSGLHKTFDGLKPWHVKQVDAWLGLE